MSNPLPEISSKSANPTSPTRPKHLTTRSISEIHKHHHHPHLHPPSLHRKKEDVVPAHPNLHVSTSYEGSSIRSDGVAPGENRDVSLKGSVNGIEIPEANGRERRPVKEGEVRDEREKGALRAAELRNALLSLNTLANNTTQRLDNTYYSVLEKLSTLQNTMASLKELANMTRKLNADFKTESEEVVNDINTQLSTFKVFDDQQKRIEGLAERVQAGRERIKTLASRVDIVKERVNCWEQAEAEWKEKTRTRLRIMWTFVFIFAFIITGMVMYQYTPAKTHGPGNLKGLNTTGLLGKMPDIDLENETWMLKRKTEDSLAGLRNNPPEWLEEDPRLRVFDEL